MDIKIPAHFVHVATPPCETSIAESLSEKKLKSVNIWLSYKQERGCFVHIARLANTLLKDEESARDNNVHACNFAKYLPIKNSLIDSAINLS